jgi:hypothetical protein
MGFVSPAPAAGRCSLKRVHAGRGGGALPRKLSYIYVYKCRKRELCSFV